MPSNVEAVVLDMGGILIPEVSGYEEAARDPLLLERLASLGVRDGEQLVLSGARRVRASYNELAERCAQPDLDVVLADVPADARRLLLQAFGRIAAQPPWSFAREVVAELARRYRLGLVSNTVIPGSHHARNLSRHGVLEHIECALWSANFGVRKPDPAMLLQVLARLGVDRGRALFVGDKLRTDVAAARRARVRSVWVRRDGTVDSSPERPDFVLQDLRELPALLRRLG